jgi:hypothetical protein
MPFRVPERLLPIGLTPNAPQIVWPDGPAGFLRLLHGASANSHPALEAHKRAFPQEAAEASRLQERLEKRGR